jgi:hypothetical protein
MAKGEPIWSRAFAQKIGTVLGFPAGSEGTIPAEAEALLRELTEDLRYLRFAQWRWIEHLARFLGEREAAPPPGLERLREVRSYVAFLRNLYGNEQPADESDEWSDEDRRDIQLAARRRLEEEDPYPWPEEPGNARAG